MSAWEARRTDLDDIPTCDKDTYTSLRRISAGLGLLDSIFVSLLALVMTGGGMVERGV